MASPPLPPESSRNARFQRWYFGWAEKHYARMSPSLREQVQIIDSLLYSRRGIGVWVGRVARFSGACSACMAAADRGWRRSSCPASSSSRCW